MLSRKNSLIIVALLASAGAAFAQSANSQLDFPGEPSDWSSIRYQQKAEFLYNSGQHLRALRIYENELAPRGDKFAQYMVASMYANGEGTRQNRVHAYAWHRLAAQRGHRPLLQALADLRATLTAEQIAEGEQLYNGLLANFGDRALLERLIARDTLSLQPGNRSNKTKTSNGFGLAPGSGNDSDRQATTEHLRKRIAERRAYLDRYLEHGAPGEALPQAGETGASISGGTPAEQHTLIRGLLDRDKDNG